MKNAKSIMEMARGAFLERVDYEMQKVIDNIDDGNTGAKDKRKITINIEFKPDSDRENIAVNFLVKTTLAPVNPATTMLYMASKTQVVEMTPQIPGQIGIDGDEQEAPSHLKLVNFG